MTETNTNHLSWDEWDELHNPPPAVTDFDRVVERAISPARRASIASAVIAGRGPCWGGSAACRQGGTAASRAAKVVDCTPR